MKLWRKLGSGFKSNILILISIAVWHKVTQSADALVHLISFIHELTDLNITRYTRETESDKRILCISKPCGVEVKLSKSWLPTFRHITESTHDNCLVPWRIHRQNFLLKPNVDKNLWIRTISRGENWREVWIRHCRRFPQHEHFSRSRPLHCFYFFSRLTSC